MSSRLASRFRRNAGEGTMPRIRSIKPEFWSNGQILECSLDTRLLFIGLWNFCDDAGRHALREKQIKAEIFPADEFDDRDIRRMIDELSTNDLIRIYEHSGRRYIQVTGWHHQKIDRPQEPKCPAPDDGLSTPVNRAFDEHSTNGRRTFAPEGKGKEGKGREGNGGGAPDDAPPAPTKKTKTTKSQGTRIPDGFPTDDELIWATENHPRVDHNAEAAKFRDYWTGVPGQKGRKSDWPATWRNWIRKAAEWQGQHGGGSAGESPAEKAAREAREYRARKMAGAGV
jgi:hypothetical protein